MSVFHLTLAELLQVPSDSLRDVLAARLNHQHDRLPLSLAEAEALLKFPKSHQDDLWKLSLLLNVPHQLLLDSVKLQEQIDLLQGRSIA